MEENEECDEGDNPLNSCCRSCKFINGAECSDSNHICCVGCKKAKRDKKICKEEFTLGCKGKTMCDGTSSSCPEKAPELNSGVCIIESDFKRGNCTKGNTVFETTIVKRKIKGLKNIKKSVEHIKLY